MPPKGGQDELNIGPIVLYSKDIILSSSSSSSSQRTRVSRAWLASPAMGLTVMGLTACPQLGSAHELLLVVTDWYRPGTHVFSSPMHVLPASCIGFLTSALYHLHLVSSNVRHAFSLSMATGWAGYGAG